MPTYIRQHHPDVSINQSEAKIYPAVFRKSVDVKAGRAEDMAETTSYFHLFFLIPKSKYDLCSSVRSLFTA